MPNTPPDIFEDLLTKVLANGEWERFENSNCFLRCFSYTSEYCDSDQELEACEFLVDGHRAFFSVVYFVDIITASIAVIFFAVS